MITEEMTAGGLQESSVGKELAAKSDCPSSIPKTHVGKKERIPHNCPLSSTYAQSYVCVSTYTVNNIEKKTNNQGVSCMSEGCE